MKTLAILKFMLLANVIEGCEVFVLVLAQDAKDKRKI